MYLLFSQSIPISLFPQVPFRTLSQRCALAHWLLALLCCTWVVFSVFTCLSNWTISVSKAETRASFFLCYPQWVISVQKRKKQELKKCRKTHIFLPTIFSPFSKSHMDSFFKDWLTWTQGLKTSPCTYVWPCPHDVQGNPLPQEVCWPPK